MLQTVFLKNDRDLHALIDRQEDGWLAQLVAEHGPRSSDGSSPQKKLESARRQLAALQRQQRELRNDEGRQKQVERNERRLQRLRSQIEELQASVESFQRRPIDRQLLSDVVRQAYLRTLSRPPADAELERCLEYIQDAQGPLHGMRGILWTLLNTREFIVNH